MCTEGAGWRSGWARPLEAYALIRTSRASRGRGRKERVSRVTAWPLPPLLWETASLEKGGARLLFKRGVWERRGSSFGLHLELLRRCPGVQQKAPDYNSRHPLRVASFLGKRLIYTLYSAWAPVSFASDLFRPCPLFLQSVRPWSLFQVIFFKRWASCSERFLVHCTNGLTLRAAAHASWASASSAPQALRNPVAASSISVQNPRTSLPVGPSGKRRKAAPPLIVRLLLNGRGRERPRSVGSRQQLRRLKSSVALSVSLSFPETW
ncbi:uncharacterized protein LOC116101392 [Mastomys coucha]|uniref:uncharacterized protein LOC116101392 n=1 Tax=Mastomys coucha TaxID=35658 RepID=UPI001261B5F5|nr:uncharacterized protein LOC116101392 [Mastomys coucha]